MSEAISDTSVPRLALGCRIRTVSPDETMLLVPEGALRLKGSASEIISFIDGQRSVGEITTLLLEKHSHNDSPRIIAEVKRFLGKLNERSVLLYRD
jgi:pyrroloquinoline quinone biosynthesis protein D